MKKTFNYKRFIFKQGFGTKGSSNIECKFQNPSMQYLKKIIDAFRNNDIVFLQDQCKQAISIDSKIEKSNIN